ncbi:MAG: twitching motility protein PilT [Cyanobium sp. CACIAM 14]|nr:MAG: twitching motility protein PilT [Cyanobium sp. CACIAM 14]
MTPDVNVLVAASRSDHPHHRTALSWLEASLDACARGTRLRLLPMVTAGFLRLVTHPRVFLEPTPLEAAQEFLGAVLAADGVELLPLGSEWPLLDPLCRRHQLVGNTISDAWIAAAVLARQECLATFDRDFLRLLPPRRLLLLET